MKKLVFNISCPGLCYHCDSAPLLEEDVPDNWESMTDEEQHEYAKEVFYGFMQWAWEEREQ